MSRQRLVYAVPVVIVVVALVLTVVLLRGNDRLVGPQPTASTTQRGPIVYVTNLTTVPATVSAWDGSAPITVDAGMGTQLPRGGSPAAPWHVVVTSAGKTVYDKSVDVTTPQQLEVTAAGVDAVDVVHEQDGPEAMVGSIPLDGNKIPVTNALLPGTQPPVDTGVSDIGFSSAAFNSGAGRVELASGVIPPNRPGCNNPAGRAVVSSWGTLSYADLGGATAPTDVTLPSPTGDLAYQMYGDPQIARLADGDLVYMRVVGLFTPITPKPEWFSYNNSYWRGGLAVYRSHCGDDWTLATTLDTNAVFAGKCAWPQGSDSGHWFGGFDREQIYVDPFTGVLDVSTYCRAGTAPPFKADHAFDQAFVLHWHPDTAAWDDNSEIESHSAPVALTSAPGHLAMFRCEGWPSGPPFIWASADSGAKFDGGIDLTNGDSSKTCQASPRKLTDQLGSYSNVGDFYVIRLGNGMFRSVYPALIGGRQGLRVDDLQYSGGNFPNGLFARPPIMSDWPDGSIGHFSYVEEDSSFPQLQGQDVHSAVLAWTEYSPSKQQHRERAMLFHGMTPIGGVFDLSTGSWALKNTTDWGGDYEYGGFGFWNNACHFYFPWNATTKAGGDAVYIHSAIVDDPSCVTGVAPTPTATTAPTATVAASSSPTQGPSAVQSISLTIATCTRTSAPTNPWVCPLTATFALTPGAGTTIAWQVKPDIVWYPSCGSAYDNMAAAQPQPSVTVTAAQTTVTATGQIVFPDTEVPVSTQANPPANKTSLARAFAGSIQSGPVPFESNGACKP